MRRVSALASLLLNDVRYMIRAHGASYATGLLLYSATMLVVTYTRHAAHVLVGGDEILIALVTSVGLAIVIVMAWLSRCPEITYGYVEMLVACGVPRAVYLVARQLCLIVGCLPFALVGFSMHVLTGGCSTQLLILISSMLLFYSSIFTLSKLSFACMRSKLWRAVFALWVNLLMALSLALLLWPLIFGKLSEIAPLGARVIDYITPSVSMFLVVLSLFNFLASYVVLDEEALVLYAVRLRRD